ncbi:MAG: hypothetical protein KF823_04285 [Xanthomonadales bacterium]|nr:hypothetical protein [Xanthomonadales bacterium]
MNHTAPIPAQRRILLACLLACLVAGPALAGVGCPATSVYEGDEMPYQDCVPQVAQTQRFGVGATQVRIAAECTDPAVRAVPQKLHMVIVPDQVTRPQLWLHLGGTGTGVVSGNPGNSQNIGTAAASLGYRFISLAYPNRRSVADRCFCPGLGPRSPACAGEIRAELLYGVDLTDDFVMVASESVVHRLRALLQWLHASDPGGGWQAYLDADGDPNWPMIAVSGFSQGGGMTGVLARDQPLARAVYFSKAADAVATVELDPYSAQACTVHEECSSLRCCSLAEPDCAVPPAGGGICMIPVPAPWAHQGRDIDGDGIGDGGVETRAVPGSRQFMLVHRCEDAWLSSPAVSALWRMGDRSRFELVGHGLAEGDGGRLFATDIQPGPGCSAHQSIAVDACQPTLANGLPVMWTAWRLMMASDWLAGDDFEVHVEPPAPTGCPVP